MLKKDKQRITRNFVVGEVFHSNYAEAHQLQNIPSSPEEETLILANAKMLAEELLQPIRDFFGPIHVSSWFRSKELNNAIKGSKNSAHLIGQAADIYFPVSQGRDRIIQVFKWLVSSVLNFDQIILEKRQGSNNVWSAWLHVSFISKQVNRKQVLLSPRSNVYDLWTGSDTALTLFYEDLKEKLVNRSELKSDRDKENT